MKKRMLSIFLLVAVAFLSMAGCSGNPGETIGDPTGGTEPDYMQYYSGVLNEFYDVILNPDREYEPDGGKYGVAEAALGIGGDALSKIGYLLKDINGDKIPELLIGSTEENEWDYTANELYAVYSLRDSKPVFVLEGRSRNAYALMEDDRIYNGGSNGAIYRIFGVYKLSTDAKLMCKEFYFSYEKDESFEDIGFYYNTTGQYDKAYAQELDISQEEFAQKEDDFAAETISLEFTPFSAYEKTGSEPVNGTTPEEPVSNKICGSWICNSQAGDGSSFVLFVDILSDGSAVYRCGPPQSEIMVDCRGNWDFDEESMTLSLDLVDMYEGFAFKGEYKAKADGNNLSLEHIGGDAFLFGTEGKTFVFAKRD